jgi:hypothetical protein
MAEEIINRVAQSKLVTFDLEDLYIAGERKTLDISQWLDQGIILREKSFRESVKNLNTTPYKDCYVALYCETDAIVPAWAYMLVASRLQDNAVRVIQGNLETLETILYTEQLAQLNIKKYKNLPVIVKGCTNKPVPQNAYLLLIEKLQTQVASLMFGEACSSVPLFKKTKREKI